jgi:elongation factor Ts
VSKNDDFVAFAQRVLDEVEKHGPDAVEELESKRVELVALLGENVTIVGATRFEVGDDEEAVWYIHPPAQKIGVLVRTRGGSRELARQVAMHIAFANPRYRTREEVPAEELAAERAIYEKRPEVASKPEQARPKIVEGMLGKRFFAEFVLADQPWIHDSSKTVGQALGEQGAEVRDFVRYALGG